MITRETSSSTILWEQELDLKYLSCPLPVFRVRKVLKTLRPGQRIRVETTDPLSPLEIAFECTQGQATLLATTQEDGVFTFLLQKDEVSPEKRG